MLRLDNIVKTYVDKKQVFEALKNVSLEIKEQEKVIIVGESGAGKTTLLNIIGLIDLNYDGTYYLNNKDARTFNNTAISQFRNQYFGYIFQSYVLVEDDSVYDNIEIPLLYSKKFPRKLHKEKIIAVAKKMNIEEHLYKKVTKLSGGERQRVAIARALVNEPEIIIMDEPTSALNRELSKMIMDYVYDYINENHKTLIIVTHDLERVIAGSYRKIVLLDGEIISDTQEQA